MPRRRRRSNRLNTAAEGIGRTLGHVAARLDHWRRERDEIAAQINQVIAAGTEMLADLGKTARKGGKKVAKAAGVRIGRKPGFKVSAATKRKLRAAWKKRKAQASKALGRK